MRNVPIYKETLRIFFACERITFQCDVLANNGQRYRIFDGSAKVEETEYPEVMGNG